MKQYNRLGRRLVIGGLSLALLGGAAPVFASVGGTCSDKGSSEKTSNTSATTPREELRDMRSTMLKEAKAEDAELESLISELNKAPESQKPDLEAVILTKLVNQHHEMLTQWESMHHRIAQFRRERERTGEKPGAQNGTSEHPTVQR